MKARSSFLATAALAAVSVLALSGCSSTGGGETESGVKLLDAGKLNVCSDVPYEPFEFEQDGKYVGFDLDIAQAIADDLGVELNVIDSSFESITSGAFKAQCDIAVSSISITEERAKNFNYSTPYYDDDLVLVAKKGSGVTDIASVGDKAVAVQQGTTGDAYGQDNGLTTTAFEDGGLQIQALQTGKVDVALGNQSLLKYAIKGDSNFEVVAEIPTGEQLGIAVPFENEPLLDQVNATLKRMTDDGSLQASEDKWFG